MYVYIYAIQYTSIVCITCCSDAIQFNVAMPRVLGLYGRKTFGRKLVDIGFPRTLVDSSLYDD